MRYNAKRVMTAKENMEMGVGEGKGESESDEEEDKPVRGPGLSVKAQGKCPVK